MSQPSLLKVDWPAPNNVHAFTTTRSGGVSRGCFDSFNLAEHVQDSPAAVATNRARLSEMLGAGISLQWLDQVHGTDIVAAGCAANPTADGSYSHQELVACCVLTADCLPLLLSARDGSWVAAIHAGWRGLQRGIIANCMAKLRERYGDGAEDPLVWLGPAIGPLNYEVGEEVLTTFLTSMPPAEHEEFTEQCFRRSGSRDKWLADLYAIARYKLGLLEVSDVFGGDFCTLEQGETYYSYRRDGQTGRMCSLIYRSAKKA